MKRIILTLLVALVLVPMYSQGYDRLFYEAYSLSKMDEWRPVLDDLEKECNSSGNKAMLYDLAFAEYGYIANRLHVKDHKTAKVYIRKYEDLLEELLEKNPGDPVLLAHKSALYGYKVGAEKHLAMFYGPKSMAAIEEAMALDSLNPFVLQVRGNIEYYRPTLFGGSKEASIPYYEKSVLIYEAKPALTVDSWLYLNCIANLAVAYDETGRTREAEALYRHILAVEPNFVRVRDELYPRFKAKASKG